MIKRKKLLIIMGATTTALGVAVITPLATGNGAAKIGFGTTECAPGNHVGNHYLANDATCAEAGNAEFWACCDCQRQYLSNPGGTFTDCGAYAGEALANTHVAYVAPTGAHAYGNHAVVADGTVSIVNSCGECGDVQGEPIATMDAKVNATFEQDLTQAGDGYRWAYNAETGVYTSTNKGKGSTTNCLHIHILTAGKISFDYTSSGEGGYDYMYFGPNTNESSAYVNCKGSGTSVNNKSGSYSLDVEADDMLVFVFKKDSSGDKGDDCGTVKFVEGTFTYNVLTLETNGGNTMTPMFIENGKVVGNVEDPVYTGKYFEGWFTDSTFETSFTSATQFTGDATIYAKWSDPLTVTLNANGGTCDASVSFQAGTTPVIPTPSRDGFYFLGWFTDADFDNEYVSGNANASFDLYAKWLDASSAHALYGNYGGFKFQPGKSTSPSDTYSELTVDVDGSYSLRKYYSGFETGILGSVSDGAVVASNNGTVQIFDEGNVIVMHEGATFTNASTYAHVLFKGSTATKAGASVKYYDKATFVKFTYKSADTIIMIDGTTGSASFNVSIVNSKGAAVDFTKLNTTSEANMYFVVKSAGGDTLKTFGYNSSNYTVVDTFAGVAGTFAAADATITFNGNGKACFSKIGASTLCTVEATGTANQYIVYSGTSYYTVNVDTANGTFTYVTTTADVTFDANNGKFTDESTSKVVQIAAGVWYDPNDKVEEPTRTGYTFNGWWRAASTKAETWVQTKTLTDTFTAHWLKNVTVSFAETDDSAIDGCDAVGAVEGGKVASLPVPTKDGFCFIGWFLEKTFDTEFTTSSVVGNEDITVYAKWEAAVTLTIHYGESEPLVVACIPNVAPEFDVSKPGFGIEGYYAESTFDTPVDLSNGIAADTTIYVKYTDLTVFVGSYVGYNAMTSNYNTVKTGTTLYDSYNSVIASNLTATGKIAYSDSGCSIIGTQGNLIVMQKKSEVVYGVYAVASDGTVFFASHYNGFKNPCTLSGMDLALCMSTGSTVDKTVQMSHCAGETNHWILTAVKGTKTYTVDIDLANAAMVVTSVVDSAA